jgi:uncharacterized protein YbcC (UPF0753/DUF2309 family)
MELRTLIRLASEIIAYYWPMRTFVHHNPLHGLEDLPFEEAIARAQLLLGGNGYFSNDSFRDYFRCERFLPRHIDAVLRERAQTKQVKLGAAGITHLDVLRACLLTEDSTLPGDKLDALLARHADRDVIGTLAARMSMILEQPDDANGGGEAQSIGRKETLAAWCDRVLGTQITEQINREMVKWCEAFLDEGHATWPMPGRDQGFYAAWKFLAQREWSPCGIKNSRAKLARLPAQPDDAVLESLTVLGIHPEAWQDYLSLHLAALSGWAGFIKWRADQSEYEWQTAYPIDLLQYLAAAWVGDWASACRKAWGATAMPMRSRRQRDSTANSRQNFSSTRKAATTSLSSLRGAWSPSPVHWNWNRRYSRKLRSQIFGYC